MSSEDFIFEDLKGRDHEQFNKNPSCRLQVEGVIYSDSGRSFGENSRFAENSPRAVEKAQIRSNLFGTTEPSDS